MYCFLVKHSVNLEDLKYKRGAVVVAAGGHLEQALRRVYQLEIDKNVSFFVPRNSQSESKLQNIQHSYISNVRSRDLKGLIKALLQLSALIRKKKFDFVLSTGAGVAIACRLVCKFKGIEFIYIESIARQFSPSMTGKILQAMRTKNLFSESKKFDSTKWRSIDSLFSEYYQNNNSISENNLHSLKIFVTLGTVHQYEFPRIIELVNSIIRPDDQLVWQIGNLKDMNLQGEVFKELTHLDFVTYLNVSDVVISHAGVGSVLSILDSGKFPILIPRLAEHGEHIDNHQLEIASVVSNLNLCTVITDKLLRTDLNQARLKQIKIRRRIN